MLSWIDGDDVDVTSRLDDIGFDFVRRVFAQERPRNSVFSPLGTALTVGGAMLFGGEPLSVEPLDWLGSRRETVAVNLADALKLEWEAFKEENGTEMHWGVYYDDAFTREEGFARGLEYVSTRMGLPVVGTQFPAPGAREINQAARGATNGFMDQVVVRRSMAGAHVAHVNAIYLRRFWSLPFDLSSVREWRTPWGSSFVTFFGGYAIYGYSETASYRYVRVHHREPSGSDLEIFMKRNDRELPTDLTLQEMERLRARAEPGSMKLFMPKWDFQADTNIVDLLPEACARALRREVDSLRIVQSVRMVVDERSIWNPDELDEEQCLDCDDLPFGSLYINHPFVFTVRCRGITEFIGCVCELGNITSGMPGDVRLSSPMRHGLSSPSSEEELVEEWP